MAEQDHPEWTPKQYERACRSKLIRGYDYELAVTAPGEGRDLILRRIAVKGVVERNDLRDEIKRLKEALAPFAKAYHRTYRALMDEQKVDLHNPGVSDEGNTVTVGDLRRARNAHDPEAEEREREATRTRIGRHPFESDYPDTDEDE